MNMLVKALLSIGLLVLCTLPVQAAGLADREDVKGFINEMHNRHGFDKQSLSELFAKTKIKQSILDAIARPAEKKAWHEYRPIFLTESRIEGGVAFWNKNEAILERAVQKYGVAPEVIVAIIGVETRYGRYKGNYRVIDALATLGFAYPPRSTFFRKELEQYLLMTRDEKLDPLSLLGSYAGAMGQPQFISSSYRSYAIDFNADGQRDIWNNPADAIGSVANYLARHGWQAGKSVTRRLDNRNVSNEKLLNSKELKPQYSLSKLKAAGFGNIDDKLDSQQLATVIRLEGNDGAEHWLGLQNFYVITRYNHSALYAMAVYQLGQEIRTQRDETKSDA